MSENESNEHEIDVTTDSCIRYYDTGEGYLVIKVRLEYHPELNRWFPIEHELVGVSNVKDPSVVQGILQEFGMRRKGVEHLPEFTLDHLRQSGRSEEDCESARDRE